MSDPRHIAPRRSRPFAAIAALAAVLVLPGTPALAANKDMIQLQTQVQQLQDAVARLQQSNDERMGVLKDLVQQSADSINKMSTTVEGLQRSLATQQEASGAKVDQVSGQVQSINDSLDEIKARMGRLEKLVQDVQATQQSITSAPAGSAAPGPAVPAGSLPAVPPTAGPDTAAPAAAPPPSSERRLGKPSAGIPANAPDTTPRPAASNLGNPAPPADDQYKTALGDYMAAKYGLAASEFSDINRYYPDNPLSGNALFYQGEIEYRGGRYAAAIKDYDKVIEQFPDNNKVPAAHLHKGQALIQLKQNEAGIRELRALVQRFPNSPEAMQARSRLSGMGVPVKPRA